MDTKQSFPGRFTLIVAVSLCLLVEPNGSLAQQDSHLSSTPVELHIQGPESFGQSSRPFAAVLINRSSALIAIVLPNSNPAHNVWARWTVRDPRGYWVAPRPKSRVFCSGTTMYEETTDWPDDGPDLPPLLGEQIPLRDEDVVLLNPGEQLALPMIDPSERFDLTEHGNYTISLHYEFHPSLYILTGKDEKKRTLQNTPSLELFSNTLTVTRK